MYQNASKNASYGRGRWGLSTTAQHSLWRLLMRKNGISYHFFASIFCPENRGDI
jgi:hypothetical protein